MRVLEARNRAGGRINTFASPEFSMRIEAGAEFIHGERPLTLALLNEAGLAYYAINCALPTRFWNPSLNRENKSGHCL